MYDLTWEYDGIDWVQRTPANAPGPNTVGSTVVTMAAFANPEEWRALLMPFVHR